MVKLQAPNPKLQRSPKFQIPEASRAAQPCLPWPTFCPGGGAVCFGFGFWGLLGDGELGFWIFERPRCKAPTRLPPPKAAPPNPPPPRPEPLARHLPPLSV